MLVGIRNLDEQEKGKIRASGVHIFKMKEIDREGMLSGPNLSLYRDILAIAPKLQLQASGGVRGIQDIVDAREVGCSGAVLGKALLDGRFELALALREERPC